MCAPEGDDLTRTRLSAVRKAPVCPFLRLQPTSRATDSGISRNGESLTPKSSVEKCLIMLNIKLDHLL